MSASGSRLKSPPARAAAGGCAAKRWLQLAVNAMFIVVGVVVAGSLLKWYEGPLRKWFMLGIALICLLPVFLWETFFHSRST
jgi:hypothetical protein